METTTAFDLNHEIARWRQTLGQAPAIHADNLDELEAHLRDTIEDLEAKGLSAEEAFVLAARRLGPSEPIEAEFAKVNASGVWLHRVLWMLIGVQAWALITSAAGLVADAVLLGGITAGGSVFQPTIGSGASAMLPGALFFGAKVLALVVIIMICGLLASISSRKGQAHDRRSVRTSWLAMAVLGGGLLILVLQLSEMVWFPLSGRLLSAEQLGGMAYSKSLASMILFVVQTVLMALATVLLATRLFGARRTVTFRSQ